MAAASQTHRTRVVVPIRSLGPAQRDRILAHLLALDDQDRYLRFGYAANDEQIGHYVEHLDFERDHIFGIYNRRLELIAMAHLALMHTPQAPACAEFGVSVSKAARGRGYGSRLFERAVMHARNEGVELIFVHALSENTAMIRIAKRAGAKVERAGTETDCYLRIPPATFRSRVREVMDEQFARGDYGLKAQARLFLSLLADMQEIRQGVREARAKSSA